MTDQIDFVLENIAAQMEKGNFLDLAGVMAKRKRAREDADLRFKVRQEQRKDLAQWIRSFKTGKGNSYATTLARLHDDPFAWGPDVAAALTARHATLSIVTLLDTHLRNCKTEYKIELTEAGRLLLAKEPP